MSEESTTPDLSSSCGTFCELLAGTAMIFMREVCAALAVAVDCRD